jgi:threonine/homoserine/homoserine lactone efflux protein
MNTAMFGSFLVGVLVMQVIPGPGMLFLLANGVAGGARAGVAVACGTAAGMLVHTTLTALGLAALLKAAPEALAVIKVIGGLYLLWLALQAFRARQQSVAIEPVGHGRRFWSLFGRGALNNLANPKIVVFYVVFLPQFVDPAVGNVTRQLFVLGGTMLLVGLVVDLQIGLLAGRLRGVLLRSRIFRQILNKISGTIYGALAARLITAH